MAPGSGNFDFEKEIESLLSDQPRPDPASATDSIYRSGSAPPTVDRAGAALLFGPHRAAAAAAEEEFRAHPDYAKYYYSNLNPRLPHPAGSREDWRAAQRLAEGKLPLGGIGDGRRSGSGSGSGSSSSLFSVQPGLPARRDGAPLANNANGPIGMGARRNSLTQPLQKDTRQSAYASGHLSHPFSRSAFGNTIDTLGLSDAQLKQLHNDATVDGIFHGATSNGLVRVRSLGSTVPNPCESDPNSNSTMARSTTPDPKMIGGYSSPCLLPMEGRSGEVNKKSFSNGFDGGAPHMSDFNDMSVAFSGLKLADKRIENGHHHLQRDVADSSELSFNMPTDERHYVHQHIINGDRAESSIRGLPFVYSDFSSKAGVGDNTGLSTLISNGHANLPEQLSFSDSYKKAAASQNRSHRSTGHYQTDITSSDFLGGDTIPYSSNQGLPVMPNNQLDTGAILGSDSGQYFNRTANQVGSAFQVRGTERLFGQYLQETSDSLSLDPANLSLTSLGRNYLGPGLDSAVYPDLYLTQQKLHYNTPLSGKSGGYNNGFYNNHVFDLNMPYRSPLSSSFRSSLDPAMTPRQNELLSRFPSSARAATRGPKGPWHEVGMAVEGHASSLLEELKNNKTRSFELSEIVSYVVIFSTDQYGSRFIQQKLESASVEEKTKIFPEILPYAHGLMTDVFGNYVIQKFFEYGTESQRNQLADQLIGHVLSFSLQMYGCRVIQKALEVIDVDRQTQMVSELDGHIMKCVRDQNGNHVIQKCIECVAQERIQFIISSFYGQVVVLSTHPYGCRVIQRVLEHCDDEQTQSKMMEEILQSVTTLAQDQYGNYVIQHVLQHGKKEERSSIISKLSGLMVKMSLQKFASNVVEKCLTYGTREERQTLIDEILDSTNENEPLEAMMKDQFGNYVVQKILETCDDHIRELILSRIKVHFNSLKRYTYGKHIVARVEKLIATGERRIGMSSSNSS